MPWHLVPQLPQFASSELVLTQAPAQRESPALQVTPHTLFEQMGVPLATSGHTLPQVPQLAGSVLVSKSWCGSGRHKRLRSWLSQLRSCPNRHRRSRPCP